MVDPDESAALPTALPTAWRTAGLALSAVVVVPAVLLYGYLLTWFLPEATGYTCGADDPACRRDPADTVYWWLLLAATVVAVTALGLCWWRRWHTGPWWPWPVAALGAVAVAVPVANLLVGA